MKVGSNVGTLKLGSTAVAAIKRGTDRVYDADVAAFQKASDAADVTGIMDLVDYLKGQTLWDYARFYPMKSSQNAGSGSTVYGLGGLTSNNMTLINSPTWGSGGVTFNEASSQCGRAGDFLGGGTLNVFWRGTNTSGSAADMPCIGQYDFGANKRSHAIAKAGSTGTIKVIRSSDGTGGNTEQFGGGTFPASQATLNAEWIAGSGRNLFINGEQESLSYLLGSTQTQRLDTAIDVSVMSYLNSGTPSFFSSGLVVFAGWLETALTTTQRETITDLINAL